MMNVYVRADRERDPHSRAATSLAAFPHAPRSPRGGFGLTKGARNASIACSSFHGPDRQARPAVDRVARP